MKVDYIIVGQGICGSYLSYYLQQSNASFVVFDEAKHNTASKIASGVINPITGRRWVRTWMIEEVMPFAVNAYKEMEGKFECELIRQCNAINFHTTPQMKLAFDERLQQESEYLSSVKNDAYEDYFNINFGAGEITPCWLIDINCLLQMQRSQLIKEGRLVEEKLDIEQLIAEDQGVWYKNVEAKKIIFCDGVDGFKNKWFHLLPYAPNKGEALLVEIKGLPKTNIYKSGISIVPWNGDLFWVGSSYEWDFTSAGPTEIFYKKTLAVLQSLLKIPFEVKEHLSGVRPSNLERRPFVGFHPLQTQIGLLNGMGTKGCSLAPYFANELVQHLAQGKSINPLADIKRFTKILMR